MTIKDVARVAGVSKSTVSRYLNNGYVSVENREKIKQAINSIGYKTNVFARGLKTNRSQLIAVIMPRLDSFTAIQTLKGMSSILANNGYQIVTVPKNSLDEDEVSYLQKLSMQGFDGIIVMAHAITDKHAEIANSVEIPIVFTGQIHSETDNIVLDDYEIGKSVALYLNKTQCKNILYLGVSESDHSVGYERKRGFLDHINAPTKCLVTGFEMDNSYHVMQKESNSIVFDTVVGATDNIALGAMRYLKDQNVSIPHDVQVIGIGDYDFGKLVTPSLTTLHINYQVLGINAANHILNRLDNNYPEDSLAIEFSIIERESTR